jgi:dipeptidyl aminopeptidase/acylaminoacyl peptidase
MTLVRSLRLHVLSPRRRQAGLLGATGLLLAACSTTAGPDVVVPTTGRYVETIYPASSLTTYADVVYSTRPNAGRQYTSQRTQQVERTQPTLTLRMDIAVPPNASAELRQPLLVLIHGGGFVAGDKSDFYPEMASYARAGYVVATINYRLTPGNGTTDTIRTTAVLHAVEDAQNAIRFLRRNAAQYGIDPTRVVTIGSSAGGGVSLTLGIQPDDPRALSDAPGVSARVDGAVSTGATLQGESDAVLSLLSFEASDSPVLLYHARETDSGTGATWTNSVLPTQRRIVDSGNECTVVEQPDMTHTVDLSIGNTFWPPLRTFLYTRLRLASLR